MNKEKEMVTLTAVWYPALVRKVPMVWLRRRIQAATDAPLLSPFSRNPLLWGSRPLRVAARDGPHCGESAQWLMKVVPCCLR
jgi:hypothetical protein